MAVLPSITAFRLIYMLMSENALSSGLSSSPLKCLRMSLLNIAVKENRNIPDDSNRVIGDPI